jgi:hypothetical protein
VVLVVVLAFSALAAGAWAVCFQRAAFRVAHRSVTGELLAEPAASPSQRRATSVAGVGQEVGVARGAVGQLEATRPSPPPEPVSVLGWDSFVLLSVLFLDGAVLLACRRLDSPGRSNPVGFEESDQTLVLRLGNDHRAAAALAVFEDWRKRRTALRLRPIEVAGAIEILDAGRTRIRAPLTGA